MARVPTLATGLVTREALPGQKFEAADVSAAGRAIAGGLEQAGAAIGNYAKVQEEIDVYLDEAGAKKIDVEYSDWSRDRLVSGADAYYAKEGFGASTLRPNVEKDITDKREELLGRATTPRMRRLAEEALHRRAGADLEGVANHSTKQLRVEQSKQAVARIETASNDAVTYYQDPKRFAEELAVGESEIRAEGARSGQAKEVVDANVRSFRSKTHARIGSGLIRRGKIEDAADYVEKHREILDPNDEEDLDAALYQPMLERKASSIVDGVLGYMPAEPGAPAGAGQAGGEVAGAPYDPATLKGKIRGPESGGDDKAVNGMGSSASGRYQFTKGTFKRIYKRVFGGNAEEAWATKRFDADTQEKLMDALMKDNERTLKANKLPVTNGNMYVLHVLGSRDGARILTADPNTPVASLLSAEIVAKNPTYFGGGKTVGQSIGVISGKVGGAAAPGVQQSSREHDLAAGLARIDAMDLPFDLKREAKRELEQRVGTDEKLKARDENKAAEAAEKILADADAAGKPITKRSAIPAWVWSGMSASARLNVGGVIDQNARPASRETNFEAYTELSDLYAKDPQKFAELAPSSYRNALSDSDYEKVIGWRRDVQTTGGSANAPGQVTHARIRSVTKPVREARGLTKTGIRAREKEKRAAMAKREYLFEQAVARDVENWQRANPGKVATDDVIQQIADRNLIKTREADGTEGYWFERPGRNAKGSHIGTVSIPRADVERLRRIGRQQLGRDPTDLEVTNAYFAELEVR